MSIKLCIPRHTQQYKMYSVSNPVALQWQAVVNFHDVCLETHYTIQSFPVIHCKIIIYCIDRYQSTKCVSYHSMEMLFDENLFMFLLEMIQNFSSVYKCIIQVFSYPSYLYFSVVCRTVVVICLVCNICKLYLLCINDDQAILTPLIKACM